MSSNSTGGRHLLLVTKTNNTDWTSNLFSFMSIWGLPTTILCLSPMLENKMLIGWIWMLALVWMGSACLLNARKCKRTHCFYTGPFFIFMAVISLLYGTGYIEINENGWLWLGSITALVSTLIWVFSESILGKYLGK